jgi:hypothetical protein
VAGGQKLVHGQTRDTAISAKDSHLHFGYSSFTNLDAYYMEIV